MEELKVSAEPVLPIETVCDDFGLVEVCTKDRAAGDPVKSGALLTTSVIGIRNGLFAAPNDVTCRMSTGQESRDSNPPILDTQLSGPTATC